MAVATKSQSKAKFSNEKYDTRIKGEQVSIPTTAKDAQHYLKEQKIDVELGTIRASDGSLRFFIDELYDAFGYAMPLSNTITWYTARLVMQSKYGDRFLDLSIDDMIDHF
jgi:hypothetical protein